MINLLQLPQLWTWMVHGLQASDDPPADETPPDASTDDPSQAIDEAGEGGEAVTPDIPDVSEVLEPISVPVRMASSAKTADPIEALSDTAETATEAAGDFVTWVGSGQRDALIAVALVVIFFAALRLSRWAVLRGVRQLPSEDDYSLTAVSQRLISRFHSYFMLAIAFAVTDAILPLPDSISGFVRIFFVLAAVLQIAEWVQEFAVSAISRNLHRGSGDARTLASAFNVIKWFISFGIWAVALLLILDNVGADVTALLAGLGIGGIAIGIAAQGVFRDLFSSLSIVIDKPFQVGDTVRYGDSWGAIEEIGLKTTRVRARSGEQLIISNTNLLDFEIHNMARMVRRRIETGFGVIYQTPPDLADEVPEIVQAIIKKVPGVEFERCGMSGFGASSLDYTLIFYSLHPDYNRSMTALSRVLLALFRGLQEHGLEFAYPTQTLYIEGVDDVAKKAVVQDKKDSS